MKKPKRLTHKVVRFRFFLAERGSRLTASAHEKQAFLSSLVCASVQPDADEVRSGLHSPYLRHLPNAKEKDPNESDLFRQMVEIGSRLTASAHGKHAFLSYFICASVQPDTDKVRSGLHSPYLRHENNKKNKPSVVLCLFSWWN